MVAPGMTHICVPSAASRRTHAASVSVSSVAGSAMSRVGSMSKQTWTRVP